MFIWCFISELFFSLTVPLLYCCNFVRQCVCQHEMCSVRLFLSTHCDVKYVHEWNCTRATVFQAAMTLWRQNHAPDTGELDVLYKYFRHLNCVIGFVFLSSNTTSGSSDAEPKGQQGVYLLILSPRTATQGSDDSVHFYLRKWKRRVNVLQKQHSVQQTMHITRMPGSLATPVSQLSTHPVRRSQSQHRTDGPGSTSQFILLLRCRPRPRGISK